MATANGHRVIALEEHYIDQDMVEDRAGRTPGVLQRLQDLGDLRLQEMDEAGIDFQVIAHAPPPLYAYNAEAAVETALRANDRLHAAVQKHPDRFAGFAVLPTPDPVAAADELERAVTRLGFKGAMVHGLTAGHFLDEQRFWPIYERAQALDVPIYVHPGPPHPAVVEAYYKDYIASHPSILTNALGFTVETATQVIRLVLSGVFDKYPDLKMIVGHMGEAIPFLLWRIDHGFQRGSNPPVHFRDVFSSHFYITTAGFFSTPALLCSMMEIGIDRILFSVDYPYVENSPGTQWASGLPISAEDKEKLLSGNAKRLLKL